MIAVNAMHLRNTNDQHTGKHLKAPWNTWLKPCGTLKAIEFLKYTVVHDFSELDAVILFILTWLLQITSLLCAILCSIYWEKHTL